MLKFLLVFLFSVFVLYSQTIQNFNWPLNEKKIIISSTFGESRFDHFHSGIDVPGDEVPIFPIASGKILYLDFQEMYSNRFLSGTGNQIWLEHDQGFWSGYYHLKKFFPPDRGIYLNHNESFGLTGNTGKSYGAHLHFFILSDFGKKILNPLLILPEIEKDVIPPEIEYLAFLIPEKDKIKIHRVVPEKKQEIRLTQKRPIYLKVFDSIQGHKSKRIPYKIEWSFENSEEVSTRSITFDYIEYQDQGFLLNSKYSFENIFYKDLLNLGLFNFAQGENKITIIAYDYSKNSTKKTFYLWIKKEY